jgi:hypothetical protein
MKTIAIALLTLAALPGQTPRTPATVAGRWVLTTSADGPHGATSMPLALAQDGRKVTGTLTPPHGGDLSLSGEFVNGELKLATPANKGEKPGLTLQAKLQDDGSLAGFLSGPMGDMTWTAARAKGDR